MKDQIITILTELGRAVTDMHSVMSENGGIDVNEVADMINATAGNVKLANFIHRAQAYSIGIGRALVPSDKLVAMAIAEATPESDEEYREIVKQASIYIKRIEYLKGDIASARESGDKMSLERAKYLLRHNFTADTIAALEVVFNINLR